MLGAIWENWWFWLLGPAEILLGLAVALISFAVVTILSLVEGLRRSMTSGGAGSVDQDLIEENRRERRR